MTHTQRSWTDDEGPLPCAKCGAPEVVMDWGDMNELLGEQRGQWLHTGLCEACGEAEKERVERQRNNDRAEAALGAAKLPQRAYGYVRENPDLFRERVLRVWNEVESAGSGHGVLLCGQPGTCKTTTAVGVLMAAARRGTQSILYVSEHDYLRSRSERSIEPRHALNAHLLVFDDLGAAAPHRGPAERWMAEVVAGRYDRNLKTIWTSNYDLVGLSAVLGERECRRLSETTKEVRL